MSSSTIVMPDWLRLSDILGLLGSVGHDAARSSYPYGQGVSGVVLDRERTGGRRAAPAVEIRVECVREVDSALQCRQVKPSELRAVFQSYYAQVTCAVEADLRIAFYGFDSRILAHADDCSCRSLQVGLREPLEKSHARYASKNGNYHQDHQNLNQAEPLVSEGRFFRLAHLIGIGCHDYLAKFEGYFYTYFHITSHGRCTRLFLTPEGEKLGIYL